MGPKFYKTNSKYIAISLDHAKYMLLSDMDANICTHTSLQLCNPDKAIFTTTNSRNCLISLFFDKDVTQNCHIMIHTEMTLPSAIHISKGTWAISIIKPMSMNIVCDNTHKQELRLKPYFQIIKLASGCHAFSAQLTLPSYFIRKSDEKKSNKFVSMLFSYNQSKIPEIWQPLYATEHDPIKLPKALEKVPEIPMKSLINSLDKNDNFDTEFDLSDDIWSWRNVLLMVVLALVSMIVIYVVIRKVIPFVCKNGALRHLCVDDQSGSIDELRTQSTPGNKPGNEDVTDVRTPLNVPAQSTAQPTAQLHAASLVNRERGTIPPVDSINASVQSLYPVLNKSP